MAKQENKIQDENAKKLISFVVEGLNINGEGFAKMGDTKVCVQNVLPGEEVEAKPVFSKNNFIKAKLNKILIPASSRINPRCKYFNKCGGCNFQHINYEDGINLKQKVLQDYFSNLLQNTTVKVHKAKNNFNYRNKVSFLVKNNIIGLQEENSNNFVPVDNCEIAHPIINKVLVLAQNWLKNNPNISLNHLVVRVLNNNCCIVLVTSSVLKGVENLIDTLKLQLKDGSFGLYINYNKSKDKILSNNFKFIYGNKYLTNTFMGIKYKIHPNAFMQVNSEVQEDLYLNVLQAIKDEIVIEGFSGAGLLSAIMSKSAKFVYGVEIVKEATQNADMLKKDNNISNLQNINGDCKVILPELARKHKDAIFVLDPPRSGCDKNTLDAIIENKIKKVVYISCNPYTLRQNLVYLSQLYKVDSLQFFDMFPQTFNVEGLAILSLKN